MDVTRAVFKVIVLNNTRVEEGWKIELTNEEGEAFEGTVTKIEAKKITIQSEDETFGRVFEIATTQAVKVISEEVN